MRLFRKGLCGFLFVLFSVLVIGQQPYSKTLLWRISGKGLTKPSYLFGTMHLNDKRLFRFGDSVYRAIENCEGLAIEVSPDEMGAYMANKMFDEFEGKRKVKDLYNEEDFEKYSAQLSKKFKKPAEKITTNDIVKEKNKWMSDIMEKGEMPTFVDAYLYNIARKQGKWLGGIEDMSDQAGLMDDLVDKSDIEYLLANDQATISKSGNSMIDKMIALYTSEDIEAIEALSLASTSAEQKDLVLIKRNVKMARRIDSLTALRTMFLAVGAAHLPGDSGVIDLLRKRGFTVEPVMSAHKIDSKDYTFKEVHLPWLEVNDSQELYKISMPANPATVKLYDMMEMKFLLDLFNMSAYCSMAMINPDGASNKDSLIDKMAQQVFLGKNVVAVKKLNIGGGSGKEYIQKQEGAYLRLQLIARDKVLYMLLVSAYKKEMLTSADADKFFGSLTISQKKLATAGQHIFSDSIMGIRFSAPAVMSYNKKFSNTDNESWKISCFTGTDLATGMYIMLFSKEVKAGHYISSDSVTHRELLDGMEKQYSDLKKEETSLQGNTIIRFTGKNIEQPGIFSSAISTVINNRSIILMVISDSVHMHNAEVKNIFNSLAFIKSPGVQWQSSTAPDNSFSGWTPGPLRKNIIAGQTTQLLGYDTTTSTSYFILPDTLDKYTWAKNDSTFWASLLTINKGDGILIEQKDIINGDLPGKEYLVKSDVKGNTFGRIRLFINGNIIYKLVVSGNRDLLYNTDTEKFFTSFKLSSPKERENFITTSKAKLLLQDLTSQDSVTRRAAYMSFGQAPFAKEDVSILQEALFKDYQSPYYQEASTFINDQIAMTLAELNDPSTIALVKKNYPLFVNEREKLKGAALLTLAKTQTIESYLVMAGLLSESAPKEQPGFGYFSALTDSLPLAAIVYPAWQVYAKDSALASLVAGLAVSLLDSGYIKRDHVSTAEKDFINVAGKFFRPQKKKEEDFDYQVYNIVDILGWSNSSASNKMLKDNLDVKDKYLKKKMAVLLLKNKQQVPAQIFNDISLNAGLRSQLYDELKEMKNLNLFPKKYLTQAYFAESAMYNAGSDDESPEKMVFLSKKTAKFKGKTYSFYLYKVFYDGDDESESYLGIAGGFDTSGTGLKEKEELSGLYWKETFDAAKVNLFFKEYLKGMEEPEEAPEEE
jgi:uncharacterized protein YbaP (TraB family)